MPGCQVIKSNDKWCRNHPMKGKTCCWSHRKLEDTITECFVKPKKALKEPKYALSELVQGEYFTWKEVKETRLERSM